MSNRFRRSSAKCELRILSPRSINTRTVADVLINILRSNKIMAHSNHGIVRPKAEEQPADKDRVRTVHQADPSKSVSREATRNPDLNNAGETPATPERGDAAAKH
jgi:hypothetical protein